MAEHISSIRIPFQRTYMANLSMSRNDQENYPGIGDFTIKSDLSHQSSQSSQGC